MRDIKTIASELDVTVQTVYNHLNKNKSKLKGNLFKQNGINMLDDEGVRILKESMGLIEVPMQTEYVTTEAIVEDISTRVSRTVADSIIDEISLRVATKITGDIHEDYKEVGMELAELRAQNEQLMKMIQQLNEDRSKGFFGFFKKK